jgi:hypothetical protein
MILRETPSKMGEILWKPGDQAKFGLVVNSGSYKFFSCPEADQNYSFVTGNFIGDINAMVEDSA